jgi:hypothetical protein
MDREPVKNEIAAVAAILTAYVPYGPAAKPASDLPKVVDEMNAAGAKKIMDEMQKQINEWMKKK